VLPEGARFCASCGAPVSETAVDAAPRAARVPSSYTPPHLVEKVLGSRFALEGERKQVTVLFADMVGSSELAERIGADAMHQVLDVLFETSLAAIHRYEGTVNQFLGDGFMALFGAPVAHEDHARRAVRAALEIQRSMADLDVAIDGHRLTSLPLRIGLNTGMVVVGAIGDNLRMDYTAIGDSTNLAARVMAACPTGEVYAAESTYRLVEADVEWLSLGRRPVKGFKEPVGIYRALRPRSAVAVDVFAESAFVGRSEELETLAGVVDGLADGHGAIASVLGEPGLGKSRLLAEVRRRYADRTGAPTWLEGRSLSFGGSLGYWPFQDMLRRWIGVSEEDPVDRVSERLTAEVDALFGAESPDVLPYLFLMLGLPVPAELEDRVRYLDNQASGAALFRAVRLLVDRLAARGPVVLVFEDVHWADPGSVDLIQHLFPLVRTRPLLILGVARPEQHSAAAAVREAALAEFADQFHEVRLRPLSPEAGRAMLDTMLQGEGASRLRQRILDRTEGNPFYTEEVVRTLDAEGVLLREANGRSWRIVGDVDAIAMPDSVQSAIGARIDRLDDELKHVLKVAAVIGRTFLYRVLEALADPDLELDTDLERLKVVELIRERRRDPELEFAFTHALIQEAAYDSILTDSRRRLHLQVAESVEVLFKDRLDEVAGILAHHFAAAERWDRAQEYLFRAADNAGRLAADSVALAQYEEALAAYERAFGDEWDPLDRARLERKLADALFRLGRHGQAIGHAQKAFRLLGTTFPETRGGVRLAIVRQFLLQLWFLVRPRWMRRTPSPETVAVQRERAGLADLLGWMDFFLDPERWLLDTLLIVNSGEKAGNAADRANGCGGMTIVANTFGLKRLANRYVRLTAEQASEAGDPRSAAYVKLAQAWHEAYNGRLDMAAEISGEGAEAYRLIGDQRRRGALAGSGTQFSRVTGAVSTARDRAATIFQLGQEGNDTLMVAWGAQNLSYVESCAGDAVLGQAYAEQALEIYRAIPSWASVAEALGDLATCRMRQGDLEAAAAALDEAHAHITEHELRGYSVSYPVLRRSQVRLAAALQATGSGRTAALAAAKDAVADAVRHARTTPGARPWATGQRGTLAWLRGDEREARACWERAVQQADEMGIPYAKGLALLDRGRCTGDRDDLLRAVEVLDGIGMTYDAADARSLLRVHKEAA
jgi:class 3 adenylate cyclase/tetratricopeptide (TPR) repeat protein